MDEHTGRALQAQVDRIAYLRATGPNPFDYFIWADTTDAIVAEIFGAESPETLAFGEAVYRRGRTVDQRGLFDNMTLGLHGEWGIWARLDRAQGVLEQILSRHEAGSGAAHPSTSSG